LLTRGYAVEKFWWLIIKLDVKIRNIAENPIINPKFLNLRLNNYLRLQIACQIINVFCL
jgi:hypothetical protein